MEFDDTQQAIEGVIRDFCQREIEPCILQIEAGKLSTFDLMFKMSDALDLESLISSGAIAFPPSLPRNSRG